MLHNSLDLTERRFTYFCFPFAFLGEKSPLSLNNIHKPFLDAFLFSKTPPPPCHPPSPRQYL